MIMDEMKAILDKFLQMLLQVFPRSPFAEVIDSLEGHLPFLQYLNWFVPVGKILEVAALWLTAIGIYYLWSVIARWVKLIS